MTRKTGWTKEEYGKWSVAFALFGTITAFGWLWADFWVPGLATIAFYVLSFWYDIEAHRG